MTEPEEFHGKHRGQLVAMILQTRRERDKIQARFDDYCDRSYIAVGQASKAVTEHERSEAELVQRNKELGQGWAEWKHRAIQAEARAEQAERERDEARADARIRRECHEHSVALENETRRKRHQAEDEVDSMLQRAEAAEDQLDGARRANAKLRADLRDVEARAERLAEALEPCRDAFYDILDNNYRRDRAQQCLAKVLVALADLGRSNEARNMRRALADIEHQARRGAGWPHAPDDDGPCVRAALIIEILEHHAVAALADAPEPRPESEHHGSMFGFRVVETDVGPALESKPSATPTAPTPTKRPPLTGAPPGPPNRVILEDGASRLRGTPMRVPVKKLSAECERLERECALMGKQLDTYNERERELVDLADELEARAERLAALLREADRLLRIAKAAGRKLSHLNVHRHETDVLVEGVDAIRTWLTAHKAALADAPEPRPRVVIEHGGDEGKHSTDERTGSICEVVDVQPAPAPKPCEETVARPALGRSEPMEYHLQDGTPTTLDALCRIEPRWAANRIRAEIRDRDAARANAKELGAAAAMWHDRHDQAEARADTFEARAERLAAFARSIVNRAPDTPASNEELDAAYAAGDAKGAATMVAGRVRAKHALEARAALADAPTSGREEADGG